MDIALIIGVIFGFVCMIGSIAYALFVEGSAGGFGNFLSAPSFGIVFGGMIASIFVAFPMPHVVALGKAIGAVLKPADDKMGPLVDEAVDVAEVGRKGAADLEKSVDGIKNYSDYSLNPLIVLPLLAGAYGGFLIIKKAFRLAKQFENAE